MADSVSEAIKTLSDEGIIAAPVLNEDDTYAGFITMSDLIDFCLELVDEATPYPILSPATLDLTYFNKQRSVHVVYS